MAVEVATGWIFMVVPGVELCRGTNRGPTITEWTYRSHIALVFREGGKGVGGESIPD